MLRRLAVVFGLVAFAWVLSSTGAHAQDSTYWCSAHPALHTCIVSATYDGGALTASDPTYDVWAIPANVSGAHTVQWSIQSVASGDLSAALGHTFSVTIRTKVVPREIDGFGASQTYTRSGPSAGEYQVTITGQPVSVTDQNGCTFPPSGPTCTAVAPGPSSVILQGEISDYNYTHYTDSSYPAGFVDSFYGMDMYTNVAETSLPPSLMQVDGQNELQIELTDHHFLHDGTTVVHGNFYLRIPATFLATYWGINDPATLATNGLNATVGAGGGTLAVTVEPGNTGVQVNIANLTFSRRKLKIKLGVVTPRAPTHVKATRSGTTAKVTFTKSRPRGQRVTGYKLSCKATNGTNLTWKTRLKHSPFVVAALASGQAYRCNLRARSKAGYGPKSVGFVIHAHNP